MPGAKAKRRAPNAKGARKFAKAKTKLDLIVQALQSPAGASIQALTKLTGWQPHSIRGAFSGALKARGLSIRSAKIDGERRYRVDKAK